MHKLFYWLLWTLEISVSKALQTSTRWAIKLILYCRALLWWVFINALCYQIPLTYKQNGSPFACRSHRHRYVDDSARKTKAMVNWWVSLLEFHYMSSIAHLNPRSQIIVRKMLRMAWYSSKIETVPTNARKYDWLYILDLVQALHHGTSIHQDVSIICIGLRAFSKKGSFVEPQFHNSNHICLRR